MSSLLGREADLRRLRDAVLAENAGPVLIVGEAGLGKTTLAQALFGDEAVVAKFGRRRYWADVPAARNEGDILSVLASTLPVAGGAGLRSRVFEDLADAPALLVLKGIEVDQKGDAVSMDEFANRLSNMPGLAWVVTSRRLRESFSVRWREIVQLEPLTEIQARQTFLDVAGARFADDPLVGEIVAVADRLPGALGLLARQVDLEGGINPVLERWRASGVAAVDAGLERSADRTLARALAVSLGSPRISTGARRLLIAASAFPDGLGTSDLRVLGDVGDDAVRELSRLGLISAAADRLRVPSGVSRHVQRLWPADPETTEALDGLYLERLEKVAGAADLGSGDAAFAPLTTDLRNIEAAIEHGLSHGDEASPMVQRAANAAYHYGTYIAHAGVGNVTLLERARDVARAAGDLRLEARCASRLGDIALGRFDHSLASSLYEEARAGFQRTGDLAGEAHCIRNLAVIAMRTQRWREARTLFEHAIELARQSGDLVGHAVCVERLGDIALSIKEWGRAREHLYDALGRYQALKHEREADCWLSIAELAETEGNLQEARDSLNKALAINRRTSRLLGVANSLMRLGELDAPGEPLRAEAEYREALSLYRKVGNVRGEGNVRVLIAQLAVASGDTPKAAVLFREALNLYRSTGDLGGEVEAISGLADVARLENRTVEADAFAREAAMLQAEIATRRQA